MELNIIEQKKNRLVFEIKGEDHTFCNLLKTELWVDSDVKVASYNIKHPLVGTPHFVVETNGNVTPETALTNAAKRIGKSAERFKEGFLKEVK